MKPDTVIKLALCALASTVAVLLAGAGPAAATTPAAVTAQAPPVAHPSMAPVGPGSTSEFQAVLLTDAARLHARATFTSTTIGLAYPGDDVTILCVAEGPPAATGEFIWVHVVDFTNGVIGWANSRYITWKPQTTGRLSLCTADDPINPTTTPMTTAITVDSVDGGPGQAGA